ncbi:hypothetical protein [Kribbella deserti]|uniref:Uncharacterized protein n=1 Tax=Kribbella deserti TaxID=1926257 RepID=A0ABV6QNE0_9ACTN
MKLRYQVPHKVTVRMVGTLFVATCSCNQFMKGANPRKYAGLAAGWYDGGMLPDPIGELLTDAHRHATDHVLAAHRLERKAAA